MPEEFPEDSLPKWVVREGCLGVDGIPHSCALCFETPDTALIVPSPRTQILKYVLVRDCAPPPIPDKALPRLQRAACQHSSRAGPIPAAVNTAD